MQDVIQITRYMDKFTNIMVIKLKMRIRKQMFNIGNISSQQIVHTYHMEAFQKEAITEVRA